jgi:membrane protein implicated in regulation of membrane protease activity
MNSMSGKLDWNKIGVIATCASLALGVFSYFRPADPAHPTRFDFLSKTISIPLWLAVVLLITIPAITAMIVRRVPRRSLTPAIDKSSAVPEKHGSAAIALGKLKATLSAPPPRILNS